ncbi:MAG: hypothetical protein Q8K63_05400 [Acidimicrobiales bacterium]|nr:hypothetical protein [Acidimicrobiales bacterium]
MTLLARIAALTAVAVVVVAYATPAHAAVSISVPTSVNLGSAPSGSSTKTGQLGLITVNGTGLVAPSFISTVSTSIFTTGGGGTNERIPTSAISYWSGPAVASVGTLSVTPGQANAAAAQVLSSTRTAFSATGLLLTIQVSWNPTLIITIPSSAVAGTYSGVITHSVA